MKRVNARLIPALWIQAQRMPGPLKRVGANAIRSPKETIMNFKSIVAAVALSSIAAVSFAKAPVAHVVAPKSAVSVPAKSVKTAKHTVKHAAKHHHAKKAAKTAKS